MAERLGALTALAADLSLVPSTHLVELITAGNSRFRGADVLFCT